MADDGFFDFLVADDAGGAARNQKLVRGAHDGVGTAAQLAEDTDWRRRRSRLRWIGRVCWIVALSVLVGWVGFALFAV